MERILHGFCTSLIRSIYTLFLGVQLWEEVKDINFNTSSLVIEVISLFLYIKPYLCISIQESPDILLFNEKKNLFIPKLFKQNIAKTILYKILILNLLIYKSFYYVYKFLCYF